MRLTAITTAILAVGLLAAGCGQKDDTAATPAAPAVAPVVQATPAVPANPAKSSMKVMAAPGVSINPDYKGPAMGSKAK